MSKLAALSLVFLFFVGVVRVAARPQPFLQLPNVEPAEFPAEVRDQVRQAYEVAHANPDNAGAVGKLGMILDLYDRPDAAALCYRRAHSLQPQVFKWLYYLGSVHFRQKHIQEATTTLSQALALKPDYLPAQLKLAEALFDRGEIHESTEIYQAILRRHSDCAEAHLGMGRIHSSRRRTALAVQSYRRACELFPPYGAAHYALALLYRRLGELEKAKEEVALYDQNPNLWPPVPDPLRDEQRTLDLSAASHLRRGVELSQAGRPQDAIAEHEKALRLDPGLVQAHANLIALYGRLGMFDKGEEHYKTVLALNPNQFPNAHYDYGVLLFERHRYDEAEQAFRKALQINPHHAKARYNLGIVLETKGRFKEALEQFEEALEDQPAYQEAHFQIGRILVNEKKFDGAIQHFLQILDPVNSETSTYLYALGAAYARAGNRTSALHYLEMAREQAAARGQSKLLADIERDLKALNESRTKPE